MEVLTGERGAAKPEEEEFRGHIIPFSETAEVTNDLLFANPTPVNDLHKLAIWCTVRSPAVAQLPDDLWLADPAQLGSGASGVGHQGEGSLPENNCGGGWNLIPQGEEFIKWNRKRKRTSIGRRKKSKRIERVEHFLNSLVEKMMEKQEEMFKQLIEMIDVKEKERIAREEAWRQQELERIAKDDEIRAQERSRTLAFIKILENLSPTNIRIPLPVPLVAELATLVPCSKSLIPQQPAPLVAQPATLVPCSKSVVPQPAPLVTQPVTIVPSSNDDHQRTNTKDALHNDTKMILRHPNTSRWPHDEMRALIALRAGLEHRFSRPGSGFGVTDSSRESQKNVWEEISFQMNGMGFDRSARKCKEKWENMNKYFKKTMASERKHSASAKTCRYFADLVVLYKNGLFTNQNETKSENESQRCLLNKMNPTVSQVCATTTFPSQQCLLKKMDPTVSQVCATTLPSQQCLPNKTDPTISQVCATTTFPSQQCLLDKMDPTVSQVCATTLQSQQCLPNKTDPTISQVRATTTFPSQQCLLNKMDATVSQVCATTLPSQQCLPNKTDPTISQVRATTTFPSQQCLLNTTDSTILQTLATTTPSLSNPNEAADMNRVVVYPAI